MDEKRAAKLLPYAALHNVVATRSPRGMDEETAVIIARRIFIHLYRGSIEHARQSLEDGWREHVGDTGPLPEGPELLAVPLARFLTDGGANGLGSYAQRLLNMLDEAGILTVGDLLRTSQAELLLIPNMGHISLTHLNRLAVELRQRTEQKHEPK